MLRRGGDAVMEVIQGAAHCKEKSPQEKKRLIEVGEEVKMEDYFYACWPGKRTRYQ